MTQIVELNNKTYRIEHKPDALIKKNKFKAFRLGDGIYKGREFKVIEPDRIAELKEIMRTE